MTDLFSWPEAPPAPPSEQRALPLPGSIAERYAAWRATPEGQQVFTWMVATVEADCRAGTRRLSTKALTERARALFHVKCNNDYTPELARELQGAVPASRGRFEQRRRTAA